MVLTALFVDVGENTALSQSVGSNYNYNKLDRDKTAEEWINQQPQFVSDIELGEGYELNLKMYSLMY